MSYYPFNNTLARGLPEKKMNQQDVFTQGQAMPASRLTAHASLRVQQRGVDLSVLDCLLQYGRHEHDHKGCEVVTFDDGTLQEVARHEPAQLWRKAVDVRSLYAVVNADGCVVTAGHRYRRMLRDVSLTSRRPGRSRRPQVLNASANRFRFQ